MWNASEALETGTFRSDEFEVGMPESSRRVMYCKFEPADSPEDDVSSAARRGDSEVRRAESDAVLGPFDELRILESSLLDLDLELDRDGAGVAGFATPMVAGVEHLEHPMVMGELDVPLAAREKVHVFDALTGEDLGAAIVNHRWWMLEDSRSLVRGQPVVYVARLIDAAGEVSELSNACEFVFECPSTAMRSAGTEHLPGVVEREMFKSSAPSAVALITQVTSQCREKVGTQSRKRPGGSKMVRCRRIITGTLTEALCAGETVRVFDGAIDLGRASVSGKSWTFCDDRILRATCALSYTAHVVDRAGNLGPSSSIYMMTAGETSD